jgi:hypothetical protein
LDDHVLIGGGGKGSYHCWNEDDVLGPIAAAPEFSEPIETVRARIAEIVGQVTVPNKVRNWHPAIDRLLKEDEKRRAQLISAQQPSVQQGAEMLFIRSNW